MLNTNKNQQVQDTTLYNQITHFHFIHFFFIYLFISFALCEFMSCYNFRIQFHRVFDLPEFIRTLMYSTLCYGILVQFTLHPVRNGFVCLSFRSLSSVLSCTRQWRPWQRHRNAELYNERTRKDERKEVMRLLLWFCGSNGNNFRVHSSGTWTRSRNAMSHRSYSPLIHFDPMRLALVSSKM